MAESEYSFGIEEEYFLVEPRSRRAVARMPSGLLKACQRRLGERVARELLQSQIEVATAICYDPAQARSELLTLRHGVDEVCHSHGLRFIACGTHPFAEWRNQQRSAGARYEQLMDDFQIVGRRNLFCGLHVHVAPPPGVDRVKLMNRLLPWLHVFLALSTSSPFWKRQRTGLMSYRQAAYDEWPRTGTPDMFTDEAAYDAFVAALVQSGALKDASYIWWAIRPSASYPTLELRIADCCTDLDDALCLAALFRCLVRAQVRQPLPPPGGPAFVRLLAEENRWLAKRHGGAVGFLDPARGGRVDCRSQLGEMLALLDDDARAFDCRAELDHVWTILERGTSAQRQLAIYRTRRDAGDTRLVALRAVIDWLIEASAPPAAAGGVS